MATNVAYKAHRMLTQRTLLGKSCPIVGRALVPPVAGVEYGPRVELHDLEPDEIVTIERTTCA
jgi:hypothetical protein